MSQETPNNNQEEEINSASDKIVNENTKEKMKKAKKGAGNVAKKVIKNPKVMAFIAAHFIPIIIVVLVILAIIILIGDVAFLLTMPGMVLEKIKEVGLGIWANFTGWFTGDSTTVGITQEDIVGLAQYLQNMGYDIESYGLGVPEYETNGGDNPSMGISKTLTRIKASEDNKQYLKAYLATNENAYALAEVSILGIITEEASTAWNFVTMGEGEIETAKDVSTGMINIINTNSEIKQYLDFTSSVAPFRAATPADYVKIDRNAKKMMIYTNAIYSPILDLFNVNDGKIQWGSSFGFDLSNWTGKYGRPLELMLALHLSTMMPDLSYRVATDKEMNTKVNIVLQDVNMTYDTKVKSIGGNELNLDRATIIDYFLRYSLTGEEHEYSYSESESETESENEENGQNNTTDESTQESSEETSNTKKKKLNIYQMVYNSLNSAEEKEEFFASIINDSNKIFSDIWGINIINSLNMKDYGIGKFITLIINSTPGLNIISRIFLDDYYVYIKHGSEIVPDLGITYDALFELAQITAKGLNGVKGVKWPYIESVTNHWFYNDIDFSKGVYRKATSAKKKIHYEPADSEDGTQESALNKEGIVVELDATLTAEEGVVYQVCEPETSGPNQAIIDIFNDSYYKYDGTTQTARAIENAKAYNTLSRMGYYDPSGNFVEFPTVEKEKVSFAENKANALAAFSMLENMHSEEADFVYRNLKDLVVALSYFSKQELTTELENILLWIIKTDDKDETWDTTKEGNKYGMTIKNVGGRQVIAPENCKVTVEGDVTTLTFTQMSDETKELLEYIYGDYYKTVNKDLLVGATMKIKGLGNVKTGDKSRGDEIGTASGDLEIKMIDMDKSLIEDLEIYMTQTHNSDFEEKMRAKKDDISTEEGIDIGRASRSTLNEGTTFDEDFVNSFDPNKEINSVTADQQKIFELLRDSGYTYESVCVIMGVMEAESGFRLSATNKNDGGFGLIQWTNTGDGGRRTNLENWCKNNGYGVTTVEGQIAFFNYELQTVYSQASGWPYPVYETLKTGTDIEYNLEMFLCHDMAGVNKSLSDPGPYNAETNTHTMKEMYGTRLSNALAFYKFFQDQKF